MFVTIRNNGKHYRAAVSPQWAQKHDNGRLVSAGLDVGAAADELSPRSFNALQRRGRLQEITPETSRHSGCQSRCILRGDKLCQW